MAWPCTCPLLVRQHPNRGGFFIMKKEKQVAERKPLSKKTRFDVFKRDNFTCQYCGKKAPDVILECDHIDPVHNGGDNSIINLITSCKDCNIGKGKRTLSDQSQLSKQRKQIEDLNLRRQQLEMMLKWKDELSQCSNNDTEIVAGYFSKKLDGMFSVSEFGKTKIRSALRKITAKDFIDIIDNSFDKISEKITVFGITKKTFDILWSIVFATVLRKTATPSSKKQYLRGIAWNRFKEYRGYDDVNNSIDLYIDNNPDDAAYLLAIEKAKELSANDFMDFLYDKVNFDAI